MKVLNKYTLLALSLIFSSSAVFAGEEDIVSNPNEEVQVISQKEINKVKAQTKKEFTEYFEDVQLVHVYTVDELNAMTEAGNHLEIIGVDNQCQFAPDIEKRAKKSVASAYQYVYGDMLINGVCYNRDVQSGIYYINAAAKKAYPAAMVKMSFYYEIGRYVIEDKVKAVSYMHEAAMMGFVPARIEWVGMLLRDLGTTKDYKEAYGWLHSVVPSTESQYLTTKTYLERLSQRMPKNIIEKAVAYNPY